MVGGGREVEACIPDLWDEDEKVHDQHRVDDSNRGERVCLSSAGVSLRILHRPAFVAPATAGGLRRASPTKECRCSPRQIRTYLSRISGPLLDRIDLHIDVPRVPHRELMHGQKGESSEAIRGRVLAARAIQRERFKHTRIHTNNQMSNRHVKQFCPLKADAEAILAHAMEVLTLSTVRMIRRQSLMHYRGP